jgi:bifunctional DNase/RNase
VGGEEELTDDQNEANEMVEVTVNGLALDYATKSPVVILGPAESEKILPIWIGHTEAWAIAMEMSGVPSKRPMTHDLIKSIIECLNAEVLQVEIFDLRDQTFYARIILMSDGNKVEVDARPSDSIALALKTKAPIFANNKLFDLNPSDGPEPKRLDPEELKERLKRINPEDFGRYSL